MKKALELDVAQVFKTALAEYKKVIDVDIDTFSRNLIAQTGEEFGQYSAESMKIFCDVLSRGGKRIRGALAMLAYKMYGGTDEKVAIEAARTMEIIQTYLLIVDDINDRSRMRRGKASAHVLLEELHERSHWKDGAAHFGESIAFVSGLVANHYAMTLVCDMNVDNQKRVRALRILNRNLQISGEGQINDIFNEVTQTQTRSQIENVLIWKTAYYTFANPLQFGATLAGASEEELDKLKEYSLAAGRTFQITDDILSTFGSEFDSGKSPMDDMREGKRTLLTIHALENTDKEDANFLEMMLGNHEITQTEFDKAKDVMFRAGSLEYARAEAEKSCAQAVECVDRFWPDGDPEAPEFLKSLVRYLLVRKS